MFSFCAAAPCSISALGGIGMFPAAAPAASGAAIAAVAPLERISAPASSLRRLHLCSSSTRLCTKWCKGPHAPRRTCNWHGGSYRCYGRSISSSTGNGTSNSSGEAFSDSPPTSYSTHHTDQHQRCDQQHQSSLLQQRAPRLSPFLLSSLRRLCRQLRFLSQHPQLLAAVRPPEASPPKHIEMKINKREREDFRGESFKWHRARQQAALLLQTVWGGATHFSPRLTLAAFQAQHAESAVTATGAARPGPTASALVDAAGPVKPGRGEEGGLPLSLPLLLTRIATHFVRKWAQQQPSQQKGAVTRAASFHAAARSATELTREAAAAPADASGQERACELADGLLAASRWLSEVQQHPVRLASLQRARSLLATLGRLEALETALAKCLLSPTLATVASTDTPASAGASYTEEGHKQRLEKLAKELLGALEAEKIRIIRDGRSCLHSFLHPAEIEGPTGVPSVVRGGAPQARRASRAELHKAADGLLTLRPLQQFQQRKGLSEAFRPIVIETSGGGSSGSSTNSGSPRNPSSDNNNNTNCSNSSKNSNSKRLRPGLLLLAHPFMADAFWRETVLLVTSVNPTTVEGLMLNRSIRSGSKPLLPATVGFSPLQLLASWREQQRQQQQQRQNDCSKESTGGWSALLREDPLLLLLLRESQTAAALHLPVKRTRGCMQKQHLQRELVAALARRAIQTLPIRPLGSNGSSTRRSNSFSADTDSRTNSSADRSSSGCFLHVGPAEASDAGFLRELLTSPTPGRTRRDWPGNRMHQQQQQQHRLLIRWLSSGINDAHTCGVSGDSQQEHRFLLQQLVHQLQQQLLVLEGNSGVKGNAARATLSSRVRLGGPCEGFTRVTAETSYLLGGAVIRRSRSKERTHIPIDRNTDSNSDDSESTGGEAPENHMQKSSERPSFEARFLGRVVWGRKQLSRELQDGLWLPLECIDARALHQLVFCQCKCNPFESMSQSAVDSGLAPICPHCDGREVYRQLLAAVDGAPNGFFQVASCAPHAVALELQQAADMAWGYGRRSATSALESLIDFVQEMQHGYEGHED